LTPSGNEAGVAVIEISGLMVRVAALLRAEPAGVEALAVSDTVLVRLEVSEMFTDELEH
jgi:hypothetical protein